MEWMHIQWGISEVLSIATNQRLLTISATNTPALIPRWDMLKGTTSGKIRAPARGVMATKVRNMLNS